MTQSITMETQVNPGSLGGEDTHRSPAVPQLGNADYPWDIFDSVDYYEHNYARLGADDTAILRKTGDFFASCFRAEASATVDGESGGDVLPARVGVDVGAGANLYPTMAMLPFCERVALIERASTNREWLSRQLSDGGLDPAWMQFWAEYQQVDAAYRTIGDVNDALVQRARVEDGDIFALEDRVRSYDLGTMFFVAESITTRPEEFARAVQTFVGLLKPGAPFVAAFMRKSEGYPVGGHDYPAVGIDRSDIEKCLRPVAHGVGIDIINNEPVRSGYDGMLLATGRAGVDH